jgi:hypothetical protein
LKLSPAVFLRQTRQCKSNQCAYVAKPRTAIERPCRVDTEFTWPLPAFYFALPQAELE